MGESGEGPKPVHKQINRRGFLKLVGASSGVLLLGGCAYPEGNPAVKGSITETNEAERKVLAKVLPERVDTTVNGVKLDRFGNTFAIEASSKTGGLRDAFAVVSAPLGQVAPDIYMLVDGEPVQLESVIQPGNYGKSWLEYQLKGNGGIILSMVYPEEKGSVTGDPDALGYSPSRDRRGLLVTGYDSRSGVALPFKELPAQVRDALNLQHIRIH
jgi:hypothetical protein